MPNNLRIRVLFNDKRIGRRVENDSGRSEHPYATRFTDSCLCNRMALEDFTDWMDSLGVKIERFEANHQGLFAYAGCSDQELVKCLSFENDDPNRVCNELAH